MADSPSEASLPLDDGDFDRGDVDEAGAELRRRLVTSQESIADLEGELKEAADVEAETAQQLDAERVRRAALDQQLQKARKETTGLILHAVSRKPDAGPSGNVDEAAGTKIVSDERAALVNERDRLAGEVAELANAVAAAHAAQAELSRTVDELRRERDEILAQSEQARADQADAARIKPDESGRRIEPGPVEVEAAERDKFESRVEELSDDDERPTRYERASAKLPLIGDDASEVIGSLKDLRESLRHR